MFTGTYGDVRAFKLGARIEDKNGNSLTHVDLATLSISRIDEEGPTITHAPGQNHPNLKTTSVLNINTPVENYNEINLQDGTSVLPRLRFNVEDAGGLQLPVRLYKSQVLEGAGENYAFSVTNPGNNNGGGDIQEEEVPIEGPVNDGNELLPPPDEDGPGNNNVLDFSTVLNLTQNGSIYEAADNQQTDHRLFNYADFANFFRAGDATSRSYFIWFKVQATDMAGNVSILYLPFKINKIDSEPPLLSVTTAHQQVKSGNLQGDAPVYVPHVHNSQIEIPLTSDNDAVTVSFKITANDNDEVLSVGSSATPNGQAILTGYEASGPAGNVYTVTRTYQFTRTQDGNPIYGLGAVQTFNILAIDRSGNVRVHKVHVVINQQDNTAPNIDVVMSTDGPHVHAESGLAELRYPAQTLDIIVRVKATDDDPNGGIKETPTINPSSGWVYKGVITGDGPPGGASGIAAHEYRNTITHGGPDHTGGFGTKTESITITATDNADNVMQKDSSISYVISNNLGMQLHSTNISVENNAETPVYEEITSQPHNVDPDRLYNVRFQWVITNNTELNALFNQNDWVSVVAAPGFGTDASSITVGTPSKSVSNNHHTFTVDTVINTSNLAKSPSSNTITLRLTTRDAFQQTKTHELTYRVGVWNFVTIDLEQDHYVLFNANINNMITHVRNSDNKITGYKMLSFTKDLSTKVPARVNYPQGSANVICDPFTITKMIAGSNTEVEETISYSVNALVTAESDGTMEAHVSLPDPEGNFSPTLAISYMDDYTLAQVIHSNMELEYTNNKIFNDLTVSAGDADKLQRGYNQDYMLAHPVIGSAISSRAQQYIASTPPSVGAVTFEEISETTSETVGQLDQLAQRNHGVAFPTTRTNIMNNGDIFVLNGVHYFERKVQDKDGNNVIIVDRTPIKLVLQHDSNLLAL